MNNNLLIVDLDGTLIRGNTFHWFIKFAFLYYLKRFSFKSILILILVWLRIMRVISHSILKYYILLTTNGFPKKSLREFSKIVIKQINPIVLNHFSNYNGIRCLSTAAPENYAAFIGRLLKFDFVLATNSNDLRRRKWVENIGENKKISLLSHIEENNLSFNLDTLITDHFDDIPLMRIFDKVILINPSEDTIQRIKTLRLKISIIND